jgi:uncharacterized membrane protein
MRVNIRTKRNITLRLKSYTQQVRDADRAVTVFVAIALFFGLLFVYSTPPLWGADETTHFGRMYQVSQGHIFSEFYGTNRHGGGYGGKVPQNANDLIHYVNKDLTDDSKRIAQSDFGGVRVDDTYAYNRYTKQKIGAPTTDYVFSNSTQYSPISYLPSAFGFKVAAVLRLNLGEAISSARLFNLLFYVACIAGALYILRASKLKWIIFTVALLPMTLFQASIITADTATNAVALLLIAVVAKAFVSTKRLTTGELIVLASTVATLPILKPTYLPLIFIILFIKSDRLPQRARTFKAISIIAGILLFGVWTLCTSDMIDTVRLVLPGPEWNLIHPELQKTYMLHHPLAFVAAFIRTFVAYDNAYLNQLFGLLGFNYVQIPAFSMVASAASLVLAYLVADNQKRYQVSKRDLLLSWGLILGSILFIFATFYITMSVVKSPLINGVQGRYFIPLLAPAMVLAALVPGRSLSLPKTASVYRNVTVMLCVLPVISLLLAYLKLFYFTYS